MDTPFLRPRLPPPELFLDQLRAIDGRRSYTNYGPVNAELERRFDALFDRAGGTMTLSNATAGLMLALSRAASRRPGARHVVVPSFTFAATVQAVLWAGLVPMFVDIGAADWLVCPEAEARLIDAHADDIAVLLPCATFGCDPDLARYERLSAETGIPVVCDAAAAIGSTDADGRQIGAGAGFPVVFSMHATKSFAIGEGGLIHCADAGTIAELRRMTNFGFDQDRVVDGIGLNAKLCEVLAAIGCARFEGFEAGLAHRERLAALYRALLPDWRPQRRAMGRRTYPFMPLLVPENSGLDPAALVAGLGAAGIEARRYFRPHMARHPFFASRSVVPPLPNSDRVAGEILCLPLWDEMDEDAVVRVARALDHLARPRVAA